MPRLDNTNEKVEVFFDFEFNDDDPGATENVDLCLSCFKEQDFHQEDDCPEHPEYIGWNYKCAICNITLTDEDE